MKKINSFWIIASICLILMMPALMSCSGSNGATPPTVLYGVTHYTANASNTSYLYRINQQDGTTTLIGDTGYKVDSIAYNPATNKLYGLTEGTTELIEINKTTGAGTHVTTITGVTSIAVNNGWYDGGTISSIGYSGSDYYAQSFIANVSSITRFGTVIQEIVPEGQIKIGIASDNGGIPNYAAPLYMGSLIDPTTTATWYYETGLNIPVTPGGKYYVLYDGYTSAGTSGRSAIGTSNVQPIPGQGIIWSNYGGVGPWESSSEYPLAIYVEGTPIFSNPAFDSHGQLFAWNKVDNSICSIDITTGAATCSATSGLNAVDFGLAFDNKDTLYLINGNGGNVYTIDTATGAATSVGTLSGLTNGMAHRGSFNPVTLAYWGLDNTDAYTATRNLLLIDKYELTVKQTIPTLDSMQALAFGY